MKESTRRRKRCIDKHLGCVRAVLGKSIHTDKHEQSGSCAEGESAREHPDIGEHKQLGECLSHQGEYEQAEEMHRRALRLKETVLAISGNGG